MSRDALPPMSPAVTLDTSRASPELSELFTRFFIAKSSQDDEGEMEAFAEGDPAYGDVVMGWLVAGHDKLAAAFKATAANSGDGRSYPTQIMGALYDGDGSALLAITNTPEIVGSELRMLSTVDFRKGKIVRWVDYWDSMAFDDAILAEKRTPADQFPNEYAEEQAGTAASSAIVALAGRLHAAIMAGDAEAAAELFDEDAIVEDMALRIQVIGKRAITRYFENVLATAPLGTGSRMRHIVGADAGGGFEWFGSPATPVAGGVTALSVSRVGAITRATTVYDSRQLSKDARQTLVLLSNSA